MKFLKENAPVVIIATITVISFAVMISFAGRSENETQNAEVIDESLLVGPESHIRGEASASATLVEFSDFQCPACATFYPIVKQLEKEFEGDLRVVYRHFPLPQHQFAQKAGEASEASGEQGKFWEYHDLLFENQSNLSSEDLKNYALELGLDTEKFNESLDSGKFYDKIIKDKKLGESLRVSATPTFYLNGKKLDLRSIDDLKREIQKVLSD